MKKFLSKSVLFMLPALLVVMGVNYFGDAAYLFSEGLESQVATAMLEGKHVTNVYNFDERKLQRNVIQGMQDCPETMVLGSSRTMLLSEEHYSEGSFQNHSVSSATYQDFGAIWEMYAAKSWKPKRVVICLDPWVLYPTAGQRRWTSLAPEYLAFRQRADLPPVEVPSTSSGKWKQLVSPSYFQSSLKTILFGSDELEVTTTKENEALTRLSDGSLCYQRLYRESNKADVNQKVTRYLESEVSDLLRKDSVSHDVELAFSHIIETAQKNGAEVDLLLVPFHPRVYSHLKGKDALFKLNKSEAWFTAFAKSTGAPIVGSYNPNLVKMDESFFYDGMHLRPKGIAQLLQDLERIKSSMQQQ